MNDHPHVKSRLLAPARTLVQRFAYVGLVVASIALMIFGKADVVLMERVRAQITDASAPILNALSRPTAAVDDAVATARQLVALRAENDKLRQENGNLRQWEEVAHYLANENRQLREITAYQPPPDATYITARVIGDTGGAFANSLILTAGAEAGVRKGQAVVTGDGLVGRIASVGRRSARILLITDLNSRIPVVLESSRVPAVLAGDNSDRPMLIHLPPGETVTPGERVVTSGHGGAFPPGLPVGVVAAVTDGGIIVQPFVERYELEYVRVVDYGLKGILPPTPRFAGDGRGRR